MFAQLSCLLVEHPLCCPGECLLQGFACDQSFENQGRKTVRAYFPVTHTSASVQVSCGTFHTCAVSSGGRLFSWGDGLCGKLGQGHLNTCPEPCQVASLADQTVLHVACGVWHTACIARPRQSQDKAGWMSYLEGPLSGSLSLEDSQGEALTADFGLPTGENEQFRKNSRNKINQSS